MNFWSHWVLLTIPFNTIFCITYPNRERRNVNETLDVDETLAERFKINMLQSRFQVYLGIQNNEWNRFGTDGCQLQKTGSKRDRKCLIFCRVAAYFATARTTAGEITKKLLHNFTSQTDKEFSRKFLETYKARRNAKRYCPQTTQISFEVLVTLISLTNPTFK